MKSEDKTSCKHRDPFRMTNEPSRCWTFDTLLHYSPFILKAKIPWGDSGTVHSDRQTPDDRCQELNDVCRTDITNI